MGIGHDLIQILQLQDNQPLPTLMLSEKDPVTMTHHTWLHINIYLYVSHLASIFRGKTYDEPIWYVYGLSISEMELETYIILTSSL